MDLTLIQTVAAAVGGGISLLSSFKWVKEGEVGILTTFGKARRDKTGNVHTIGSGFRFVIPVVQQINKVHTRKNTDKYSGLGVTTRGGLSYKFDAFVIYHVKPDPRSVENVVFAIEDYKQFVSLVFEKALQDAMQAVNEVFDVGGVSEQVSASIRVELDENGIDFDSCGIVSCVATDSTQSLLGIEFRLNAARGAQKSLPGNLIAAAIGATPVVSADQKDVFQEKKIEEE